MEKFIKVYEAPKSKAQLKKDILNGYIIVYVKNVNFEMFYTKLKSKDLTNFIKNLSELIYLPAYQENSNDLTAYFGESYFYKFVKN